MKRFFFALLTSTAAPVAAQTFSSPPDVGTYTPVAATYAAGTAANVLGDGSNAKGGTAPAFTTYPEPTNEPNDIIPAGWIVNSGISTCTVGEGSCNQKKYRTVIQSSHILCDDPLRFWGKPAESHCHEFFGNRNVNAYTTRLSLRARPNSTASGGPALSTGYWTSVLQKVIAGKTYGMLAVLHIIYYAEDQSSGQPIVDDLQPLHKQFRFIMGVNMDDPDDTKVKAEIAAANAQPGTAGRYSYIGNGWKGWVCQLAGGTNTAATEAEVGGDGVHSPGLKTASGGDPWGGRCVDGSKLYAELIAPSYWDGKNLSSPSGYDHVRYGVRDNLTGKEVGPVGWYKVPRLEEKTFYSTHGPSDYMTWSLSSDTMMAAKLGRSVLPGSSRHADWLNGWHGGTLNRWLSYCMGIGTNQPHGCDDGTIDATGRLISNTPAPDGSRVPQVNLGATLDTNDPSKLILIDTTRASHVNMQGM